jgi:hypothetical protein
MPYIPFDEVKRVTTIERVANWLGLSGTRMMCPVNQGDKRELAIFPKTQSFCCFGCKKKGKPPNEYSGDLIQLAAHIKQTPVKKEALEIMRAMHGYTPPKKGLPEHGLEDLDHTHERVAALGLTPEKAAQLGIGYRNKGTTRHALLLPIRDANGKLVGYAQQDKDGRLWLHKSVLQ